MISLVMAPGMLSYFHLWEHACFVTALHANVYPSKCSCRLQYAATIIEQELQERNASAAVICELQGQHAAVRPAPTLQEVRAPPACGDK